MLDKEISALEAECGETLESIKFCVKENTYTAQNPEEYAQRYDELTTKYKDTKARLDALSAEKQAKLIQSKKIRRFSALIRKSEYPFQGFDAHLWCAAMESVAVRSRKDISFVFQGSDKIRVSEGWR